MIQLYATNLLDNPIVRKKLISRVGGGSGPDLDCGFSGPAAVRGRLWILRSKFVSESSCTQQKLIRESNCTQQLHLRIHSYAADFFRIPVVRRKFIGESKCTPQIY